MGKKKSANVINEELKSIKNKKNEKDGIIVLNEGKVKEEELKILGTEGQVQEFTVDTSYLDEELGIADVFKENGIGVMPIGGRSEKSDKKKEKEVYVQNNEEDDEDMEMSIVEVFTMVLKNKDFEPIPYPFDSDEEFEEAFNEAIERIDHMAISKFIRKNPSLTLKDAFKHVFTVPNNYQAEQVVKTAKGITLQEVAPTEKESKPVETTKEVKVTVEENESQLDKKLNSVLQIVEKEFEHALSEVIKAGDSEPEVVLATLLENAEKLETTSVGKLIRVVTGETISSIIRAEINGKSDAMGNFKENFTKTLETIQENSKNFDMSTLENLSDEKFIEEIIKMAIPDISKLSVVELIDYRSIIAPNMTDKEFFKWVTEIRKDKEVKAVEEEIKKEEVKEEVELEEDLNKVKTSSEKLYEATSGVMNIFKTLSINGLR